MKTKDITEVQILEAAPTPRTEGEKQEAGIMKACEPLRKHLLLSLL